MKLEEIRKVLEAEWTGRRPAGDGSREAHACHASDLMSDVLTLNGAGSLLLTGLTNAQVIRVAEMSDFVAVCFVRGKQPRPETVQLAEERGIPLLVTPLSMFECCGRLYARGVGGAEQGKLHVAQ
jgi:hypothetical protein